MSSTAGRCSSEPTSLSNGVRPSLVLLGLVAFVVCCSQWTVCRRIFRWLPAPLWCYLLPMLAAAWGWLPSDRTAYRWITDQLFPVTLAMLLLGVNLPAIGRLGAQALLAMVAGAAGFILGAPLVLTLWQTHLPPEAWKGIGLLSATWTGGSMNMLALRTVLNVPDALFAPLVVVDALVAYTWMACLIACQRCAPVFNRWLGVTEAPAPDAASGTAHADPVDWKAGVKLVLVAFFLTLACKLAAQPLPLGEFVATRTGWTVLLVTAAALAGSCLPAVRHLGEHGPAVGYPCLYLVLASLGAQASLSALAATPVWIVVGASCVALHAVILLVAGRMLRLPFGVLATASQANVGGVVSAPLVGAVYDQALMPVGLLLAVAGNAVGTFLGLAAAGLARWLVGG